MPGRELNSESDYKVRLYIPSSSGLSNDEIGRVLSIATWKENPNELSDVVLSGRSVIIDRNDKTGLQISGVGYLPVNIGINNDGSIGYEENEFLRPNNKNFLENAANTGYKGNIMGLTYPSQRKEIHGVNYYEIINHYPNYRPSGTYDCDELTKKINKTNEVSKLKLEKLITTRIEAYGYYLNEELRNNKGPFGFIITTTPSKNKQRFAQEIINKKSRVMDLINGLSELAKGLKELHDNGYAHLEPHASNFYLTNKGPYLMDWPTAEKLTTNKELNTICRALDLIKPINNFESLIKISSNNNEELLPEAMKKIVSAYIGCEVDLIDLFNKSRQYKNNPDDFDIIIQSMLEHNLEQFDKTPRKIIIKKAEESTAAFIKNNRITIKKENKKLNKYEQARERMKKH